MSNEVFLENLLEPYDQTYYKIWCRMEQELQKGIRFNINLLLLNKKRRTLLVNSLETFGVNIIGHDDFSITPCLFGVKLNEKWQTYSTKCVDNLFNINLSHGIHMRFFGLLCIITYQICFIFGALSFEVKLKKPSRERINTKYSIQNCFDNQKRFDKFLNKFSEIHHSRNTEDTDIKKFIFDKNKNFHEHCVIIWKTRNPFVINAIMNDVHDSVLFDESNVDKKINKFQNTLLNKELEFQTYLKQVKKVIPHIFEGIAA